MLNNLALGLFYYPHEWNTNLSQVTLDYEQSILFIEVQFKKIDKKKLM